MPRFFALAFSLLVLASATQAHAQSAEGSPSLALRTDQSAPWQRYALSVDAAGPIWSEYSLTLHVMPSRFIGGRLSGTYVATDPHSWIFVASVDVRPMGRSFDGPFLALGASLHLSEDHAFGARLDAGYSFTWRSLLFEASGGGLWTDGQGFAARFRLAVGLAF